MRILFLGNFTNGWDGSICDERHVAESLEYTGHEVIRYQREFQRAEIPTDIDFTLIAQWNGYGTFLLNTLPRPIVYWAFDYQEPGQEWHENLVRKADLYLSKPWSDSKYSNWQWLPQDFAPSFLTAADSPKSIDVLFTGSYLPWARERIELLTVIDKLYNLQINSFTADSWRTQGFKNVQGPVMDHGLMGLYSTAKINISIDHTITPGYWSDRNSQIMATEGFVLFKYVPGSELVFRDNISYFYSIDDCLEKIKYFLDHPLHREAIAARGHDYAQNNLMVQHRVQDLLKIVGNIL